MISVIIQYSLVWLVHPCFYSGPDTDMLLQDLGKSVYPWGRQVSLCRQVSLRFHLGIVCQSSVGLLTVVQLFLPCILLIVKTHFYKSCNWYELVIYYTPAYFTYYKMEQPYLLWEKASCNVLVSSLGTYSFIELHLNNWQDLNFFLWPDSKLISLFWFTIRKKVYTFVGYKLY